MAEDRIFYDREVVSVSDKNQIETLAGFIYDEHGKQSTEVLGDLESENADIFEAYSVTSPKRRNILAVDLSVAPLVEYVEDGAKKKDDTAIMNDIRVVYGRLKKLDEKRNVQDVDLMMSSAFRDKLVASDNEAVSDAGFDLVMEDNEMYITELKAKQAERRLSETETHRKHIGKIDRDILGQGSGKGGYDMSLYEFFPDDDRVKDAAENWLTVYQVTNKCDRKTAEKALDASAEYYKAEDGKADAASMCEHLENDAAIRYSDMVQNASYSEFRSIINDPDLADCNDRFCSKFPDRAKDVYNKRSLADRVQEMRLKKLTNVYRSAQDAIAAVDINNGGRGLDLDGASY